MIIEYMHEWREWFGVLKIKDKILAQLLLGMRKGTNHG
jgi:hypothetical protein